MSTLRRRVREVCSWMASAFAEFSITSIYSLSSIAVGILLLRFKAESTWFEALSLNAMQGELMIASIAMMGPLAYSVVAEPPIKHKRFFQFFVLLFTLLAVTIYVANKISGDIDAGFMISSSAIALIFSLVLNYFATYVNHSVKKPGDKMRDSTIKNVRAYAEHARGRE
ncbi:hypothetical protein [Vreelandella alkaliphila]|uniref:MARVEL domain-containing protein n=1 Tax=Vreelandella alkaliphila TaxID=272774 RepID=A0ABX4HMA8_9GAMM|nr:hypothetical protein [Halomonas humidisoli]PAU73294.1 hypothetical protein CK497_01445 [Halomonas humidisoli]